MITRQGKQYVLFQGLLDEAHANGLRSIDTELLQTPDESNGQVAVVKATVEMENESRGELRVRRFSGIGDASPQNVGQSIAPHIIRMAETRAKARALRDAVNVGATALEELSDGDDVPPPGKATARPAPVRDIGSSRKSAPKQTPPAPEENGQAEQSPADEDKPARPKSSRGKGSARARKSQVDLIKTLAVELRGDGAIEKMEGHLGKPLEELTKAEADEWIDRLTPPEERE